MVNIKTLPDRIIFDGHADTAKECETITLTCDGLAANNNFRTVAYRKGYAEFEKVGTARELKFVGAPALLTMVFDNHITKVTGLGKEWTTSGTEISAALPNSYDGVAFTFSAILQDGYVLDTVSANLDYGIFGHKTDNSFTLIADSGGLFGTITITSKQSTPKVSIDVTTLSGYESLAAGTYQLGVKAKAANYQDSDLSATVSFTKLAAPVATAADTTVTWDAITNAESYDVYVDGELYENTTGESPNVWYVLNSSGISAPDKEIDVTIDFRTLGELNTFKRIKIYSENNETKIKYYYDSTGNNSVIIGPSSLDGTIQFLQQPPSELSEWLSVNATQQVLPILKAGTYVLKEKPEIANPAVYVVMTFETYYLTANNTYATGLWTCYGMSSGRKFNDTSELARVYYSSAGGGATQFSVTECGETTGWIHHDWNDGDVWYSYTATDTTKLRTIIISTDYTVPTAFYTWFSANTTKQS